MPSCFKDVKAFVQAAELEDSLNLLDAMMTGLLKGFEDRLSLLRTLLNLIKNKPMSDADRDAELLKLGSKILDFARDFCEARDAEAVIEQQFASQLLIDNSFPFADRTNFRGMLRNAMDASKAQIILVDGAPKSGMSHLEKFIQHSFSEAKFVEFHPFNVGGILDEPECSLGETLATSMAVDCGLDIDFSKLSQDQFKFSQFFTQLKEKISSSDTVPIFFLHDFHKAQDNNQSLLAFVQILIERVYRDFPKAIFILAGLKYTLIPRWVNDFEFMLGNRIYHMELVSEADIEACLRCIFAEYEDDIAQAAEGGEITEDDYITEVIDELLGEDRTVVLADVGRKISRLLFNFKN